MRVQGPTLTEGLDDDAIRLLRRAGWLGKSSPTSPPFVSFHSLFAALAFGDGEVSAWIRRTAEGSFDWEKFLETWREQPGAPPNLSLDHLTSATRLRDADVGTTIPSTGDSTGTVIGEAKRIADEVDATATGEWQVLAAYLLGEVGHEQHMAAWGLDARWWWGRLLVRIAQADPPRLHVWVPIGGKFVRRSQRLDDVLARTSSGPRKRVVFGSEELLGAILLDGKEHSGDQDYTGAWLFKRVGHLFEGWYEIAATGAAPLADEGAQLYARAVALGTTDPYGMGVRHLIAAILTAPDSLALDATAPKGFRRSELLPEFLAEVKRISGELAEPEIWDEILRAGEVRFAGYNADTPEGNDLLDLRRDVEGLAAVIASREVVPPLSIGLFGDWGSGKSFFMRLLRTRVKELAAVGRTTGKESAYRGRIAQIEFNAWHYADATLWASLSVHIWSSLEEELRREGNAAALVETISRLESAQMQHTLLEGACARAEGRVEAAAKELDAANARAVSLRATIGHALVQAAPRGSILRTADAEAKKATGLDDLAEIQNEMRQLGTLAGKVRTWRRARWPLILVAGAVVAGFAIAWPILLEGAMRWLASLGSVLAGALLGLKWLRRHAATAVDKVDELVRRIDEAAAAAKDSSTADQKRQLDEAKAEQIRLDEERRKLPAEIERLKKEIAALQNRVDMRSLILQQASEGDYRKYLGLVSTIHRHFSDLARSLQDADAPIERIVLYVDDLDRCPPDRVVEVLQAVHLLLSMPLFVVVVAVDSRWLLQSLEDYYARRFQVRPDVDLSAIWGPDKASAPMHYLEKIFQIPFGLRTPAAGFGPMVSRLLAPHVAPHGAGVTTRPAGPTVAAPASGDVRIAPAAPPFAPPAPPPSPRSLRLEPGEADNLARVAELIGSPRGAKRLVNLYRIVRAGVEDARLDTFVTREAWHVQLCLALVVGQPAVAASFFQALFRGEVTDFPAAVALCRSESISDPRWLSLLDQFVALELEPERWSSFYDAARLSARFSFEVAAGTVAPASAAEAAANRAVIEAVRQIPYVPIPGAIPSVGEAEA